MSEGVDRLDTGASTRAPRPFFKSPWLLAAVFGLLVLTGLRTCYAKKLGTLPVLGDAPTFTLVDQGGQPFGSEDLAGQVWVASFFFTTCVTVCPKVSGANAELQRALKGGEIDAHIVSFTVDPATDTPERLARYGLSYHADDAYWTFLTGDEQALYDVVVEGFKLAMGDKVADAAGVIDIAHSTKLVLVDKQGRIRHYFDSTDPGQRKLLIDHIISLVNEEAAQ